MHVEFIEPASVELDDAIQFYNVQAVSLGEKFLAEVLETIDLISVFPEIWSQN